MYVNEWGPAAWKFLHSITFSYPDVPTLDEQRAAESLFNSISILLPCSTCRTHYVNEINSNPPDTRSKSTLTSWLVDIHNRVNLRLGKPIFSYANATEVYASAQCSSKDCTKSVIKKSSSYDVLPFLFVAVILGLLFLKSSTYLKKVNRN